MVDSMRVYTTGDVWHGAQPVRTRRLQWRTSDLAIESTSQPRQLQLYPRP